MQRWRIRRSRWLVPPWPSYLLGDGQKLLPQLNYAPPPASIDQKATAQLSMIGSSSTASPSSS